MRIIPYLRRKYETELSKDKILERVNGKVAGPDWNLTFAKAVNNRVLEGKISDGGFLMVMGKYGLTFGQTSLLPVMMGRVVYNKKKQKNIVDVVIRPSKAGIFGLGFFYFLDAIALTQGFFKRDVASVFFSLLFFGVTYLSVMIKYNYELPKYIDLLEREIIAVY